MNAPSTYLRLFFNKQCLTSLSTANENLSKRKPPFRLFFNIDQNCSPVRLVHVIIIYILKVLVNLLHQHWFHRWTKLFELNFFVRKTMINQTSRIIRTGGHFAIFVFSVMDWNQLATEANAGSVFKFFLCVNLHCMLVSSPIPRI